MSKKIHYWEGKSRKSCEVWIDWAMVEAASPLQVSAEQLWQQHMTVLEDMETAAEQLIVAAKNTLKTLDKTGLEGYYSADHDCRQWAERLHYLSHEAQILRGIRVQIDRECGIIEQLEETFHATQDQKDPDSGSSDAGSTASHEGDRGVGAQAVLRGERRREAVASPEAGGEESQASREQEPVSQEGGGLDVEHASNTDSDEESGESDQESDP